MVYRIVSKDDCLYCKKTKSLLNKHNVKYSETKLDKSDSDYEKRRTDLISETNHKTFPWIFKGETFLGGFSELEKQLFELDDDF